MAESNEEVRNRQSEFRISSNLNNEKIIRRTDICTFH